MALLFMDGLDGYSSITDAYTFTYSGNSMTYSTSTGRFGGGALFMGDVGVAIIPFVSGLEVYQGFAAKMNDTRNGDNTFCGVKSIGAADLGVEITITINATTGVLRIWRGSMNSQLQAATLAVALNDNNWHWIDVHYIIDGSAGAVEMWVDGNSVISISSVNTMRNGGITGLISAYIGSISNNTPHTYIDDIVIVDTTGSHNNARIGDSKIEVLQPTSDATPNNGTPSTGSTHYGVVDDPTWDGTDYLTITNTSGQEELFGFADLGSTPASISAVQVTNISQKTDAGAASIENVLVSSGTESDGASMSLGVAWNRYVAIYELDPHTSSAWTATTVNAAQAGVKVP